MRADNDNQPVRMGPWLPTRDAAMASGSIHFFTGEPCRHGHIEPRYASTGNCVQCNYLQGARRRADPALEESRKEYMRNLMRRRRSDNPEISARDAARIAERRATVPGLKEREREMDRIRYAINVEAFAEKNRAYRKAKPEMFATHARNRRALLKLADGTHTAQDIADILTKQNYRCVECGVNIRDGYHVDHITPITKGGSNWPSNLQCLCARCNQTKSNADPIEFAQRKGRLL